MGKKHFEDLNSFLEHGQAPLARQLRTWMIRERERKGPWIIRMTTEGDGLGTEELVREQLAELDPNTVAGFMAIMRERIQDRHGATPDCTVRVQAYHKGEASDHKKHIHRNQRIQPAALNSSGLQIGSHEYAWAIVASTQAELHQAHTMIVASQTQTTAAMVAMANAFGVVATNRTAMTGGAEVASGGIVGIMGMLAAVYLGPKLVKMMKEGDDMLDVTGVEGLLKLVLGGANNSTMTSQAVDHVVAEQLLDGTQRFDNFSWESGIIDAQAVTVEVEGPLTDTPSAVALQSPQAVLDALARLNPDEVAAYLKNLSKTDPDNKGRTWLSENGMKLALANR